ncbi:sugar kinase [Xanthomonas populi]|uniref:2-keto-3-deoxygluconate kinase n=1 Tax=Xanthomonas populi TaxID=53414 RepID=A0A2S7ETE9_9XANT|nr:sugar kinase [Xanthomonas populi]PPU96397.1 2-keto-3-deoxygluconate kinase [Xanthomonas populi]
MSRARILCFGELLLRLGAPGHALLLQQPWLDVHCGGAEANVGVSLAHFGHEVAMVGTVADNPLGAAILGELRRHDVDTRHVRRVDGRMGLYFLTTGAIHRPSEVLYDRADSAFALAPADAYDWPRLLEGAQWLHLSGVSPALGAYVAQATLAAARAARVAGVKVSFDGNYRPMLWQRWQGDARGILHQLFDCADVVFADYRDIGVVLGGEFPQDTLDARVEAAAQQAFAAFPQLQLMACTQRVAHTVDHHSLGAMLVPRSGAVARAPSEELTPIIDRIGGGDAFAAGVLHGLIEGWPLEDTVRFGLAAGCLKHSIPGDLNPLSVADVQACAGDALFDVRR